MKKILFDKKFEVFLLLIVTIITAYGLLNLYSASSAYSYRQYGDVLFLFKKQFIFACIGIVICIILSFVDYKVYDKFSKYIYLGSLILTIITISLGTISRGSTRWITFRGITFQPSEIMKVATIIYLSNFIKINLYKMKDNKIFYKALGIGILPSAIVAINNLSTGIIIFLITFIMMFISSKRVIFFIICIFAFLLFYLFAYNIAYVLEAAGIFKNYQLIRIFAWQRPDEYRDITYQTMQGLYAIGSGGIFGRGIGESIQKNIMPEVQNDMIFTIICEEIGLIGAYILLFLYMVMIIRIIYIAKMQNEIFPMILSIGIAIHFSIQIVLNIAVVTNLLPNTGVILPFVSYGGSSLIMSFIEIGIVMNTRRCLNE